MTKNKRVGYTENIKSLLDENNNIQELYAHLKKIKKEYLENPRDYVKVKHYLNIFEKEKIKLHNLYHKSSFKFFLVFKTYHSLKQIKHDYNSIRNQLNNEIESLRADFFYIAIKQLLILIDVYKTNLEYNKNKFYYEIVELSEKKNIVSTETFLHKLSQIEKNFETFSKNQIEKYSTSFSNIIDNLKEKEKVDELKEIYEILDEIFYELLALQQSFQENKTSYYIPFRKKSRWSIFNITYTHVIASLALIVAAVVGYLSLSNNTTTITNKDNSSIETKEYFLVLNSDVKPYEENKKDIFNSSCSIKIHKNFPRAEHKFSKNSYILNPKTNEKRYCFGYIFHDLNISNKAFNFAYNLHKHRFVLIVNSNKDNYKIQYKPN
ncbi:hypothetical protein [Sulfurimonas sp.]|uniref:hypothetical protein n=1 Tax=Sulfurimonas sp. TaxID=2022749 RepID=UPI003D0E107D